MTIALLSIIALLILIVCGLYVPIAFIVVSFLGVWALRGDPTLAVKLLGIAATDTIEDYIFGVIPLFVLTGLIVMVAGIGRDSYRIAHQGFRRIPGSLGHATVGGNAIFAAVTGVSVASATVFTKLAVPEMRRYGYSPEFATGVVAGSSVLGMLIPPSVLFILYGIISEVSIGRLFLGGVLPGLLLAASFGVLILVWAKLSPRTFGGDIVIPEERLGIGQMIQMGAPIALLILLIIGGIYGGIFTPTEAGAVGAAGALVIAIFKRKLGPAHFWQVLIETGHVTASLILLIIGASVFSRMIAMTGLPSELSNWFIALELSLYVMLAIYIMILLVMGALLDSSSILFLVVPLVLPVFASMGVDLVWLGVITIITIEIGLLTPPFGMAVFIIKNTLNDPTVSLAQIFKGAAPFALVMLVVVGLVIVFPQLTSMSFN